LDSNNNTIGVVVDNGDFEAALSGDAERPEFLWWQANQAALLQEVEVYKSAHHGSKNGDTLESVQTWSPETVVISVGANNSYGHPTSEALALYQSVGATVLRTDLVGDVVVTGESDGTYTTKAARTAP
jgi:competence protein ComEC